ncbi:hypothetical protein L1987_75753 [Smallanthus sonchifolius]|uniref:Uncharacterized protein n=1 Tax=Smallanthus sonchifolius TaxID=185202 RepID=A0ACB9A6B3_9ASTR|nr:hypothetical protein L1987_75753 [Smallanthus sonchifolius]
MPTTTLSDIHQEIIQTHILPRLDGRSLSTTATVSSSLHALTSDHNLWSQISRSTWPSITHPRVDDVIYTFPGGHRSFFDDSFPSLTTEINHRDRYLSKSTLKQQPDCSSCNTCPSQLISAVDIRYQTDIIYSNVQFTDVTTEFLSSELQIKLNEDATSNGINLEVDELAGVDEETLSHLKESVTLNWILIDPTLKRAGNLSSIKPVTAKKDWVTNETILLYDTVLPGCDPNEMVLCRIHVVLGVGGQGLHVKEVMMKLIDVDSCWLRGREFLVITQGAILGESNVRRKVVDDDDRRKSRREFKEIRRQRKEFEEDKRENAIRMNYIGILVSFCFSLFFLSLMLQ